MYGTCISILIILTIWYLTVFMSPCAFGDIFQVMMILAGFLCNA